MCTFKVHFLLRPGDYMSVFAGVQKERVCHACFVSDVVCDCRFSLSCCAKVWPWLLYIVLLNGPIHYYDLYRLHLLLLLLPTILVLLSNGVAKICPVRGCDLGWPGLCPQLVHI